MIRINLHPVRQKKKAKAGQRQLLILLVVLAAEIGLMAFLYSWKSGQVDEKRQEISRLEARIAQLKKEVGDFNKLKAQRERLIAQRNIINKLQKARVGPVWMLNELSDILTEGKGPTVNQTEYEMLLRRDPNAGFNPGWNPARLWIESFSEQNGQVKLAGKAKDYDDVAEFTKRISLSKYFVDDFLAENDQVSDQKLGMKVVKFQLRCRTTY